MLPMGSICRRPGERCTSFPDSIRHGFSAGAASCASVAARDNVVDYRAAAARVQAIPRLGRRTPLSMKALSRSALRSTTLPQMSSRFPISLDSRGRALFLVGGERDRDDLELFPEL